MLQCRALQIDEANRIAEIDATNYIRNAWRKDSSGEYRLLEINWTDTELPNGFEWHLRRFRQTLVSGGTAIGCFDGEKLVGYATLEGHVFGQQKYVLLDQLFVSKDYRRKGIGKELFRMCAVQARHPSGLQYPESFPSDQSPLQSAGRCTARSDRRPRDSGLRLQW